MSKSVRLTVKFFGSYQEAVGEKELQIETDKVSRIQDLIEELTEKYPGLADLDDQLLIAVNKSMAEREKELKDGDEVAFLPPVSGG